MAGSSHDRPIYFATPEKLRTWLRKNHRRRAEAWVGLHKKATGKPSITWPELVDQLLCFGWIDGVRKSVDEGSYAIRITPRRKGSNWSKVNLARVAELMEAGLVEPAGREAFDARDERRSGLYSFERERAELGEEYERTFRANREAWKFFQAQPPGYRKLVTHWVVSAKREETRRRRLETLIRDSENGERIGPLRR